jgi:hypothetical protein
MKLQILTPLPWSPVKVLKTPLPANVAIPVGETVTFAVNRMLLSKPLALPEPFSCAIHVNSNMTPSALTPFTVMLIVLALPSQFFHP